MSYRLPKLVRIVLRARMQVAALEARPELRGALRYRFACLKRLIERIVARHADPEWSRSDDRFWELVDELRVRVRANIESAQSRWGLGSAEAAALGAGAFVNAPGGPAMRAHVS